MDWREHIISDKNILLGKPTIKGTCIPVELVLELMGSGWTENMILESYPNLTHKDIISTYGFLKETIQKDFYFPLQRSA
jgi:uncharacterized protein (DUF433 family)